MYARMASKHSCSLAGASPFSGWKHGWMIPFMSMYKLSTGPAPACSVGTLTN